MQKRQNYSIKTFFKPKITQKCQNYRIKTFLTQIDAASCSSITAAAAAASCSSIADAAAADTDAADAVSIGLHASYLQNTFICQFLI